MINTHTLIPSDVQTVVSADEGPEVPSITVPCAKRWAILQNTLNCKKNKGLQVEKIYWKKSYVMDETGRCLKRSVKKDSWQMCCVSMCIFVLMY